MFKTDEKDYDATLELFEFAIIDNEGKKAEISKFKDENEVKELVHI